MSKIIADFIKVNRELLIDMGISENANLLHGKDYSLHISQKIGAKIDTALVKEKLGELEYQRCKVPTQYKTIQAMAINQANVGVEANSMSVVNITDFKLAI
jgi:actin-related protein